MSNGGTAVVRHCAIRFVLTRNHSTPTNYERFLDHAAERILLRKVGGGYMFIHRMLLEWFAARYVEPGMMPEEVHSPESSNQRESPTHCG